MGVANRRAQPLVCVVTPVHNGQPYLAKTLACVQAQTFANLVHVVLDNASTDDTPEVIAAYAGGRVPILTRRNSSLLPQMVNWNAAVAMTPPNARYVKILAADDLMRSDCITRLVAVAEDNPAVEFVTAVDVFDNRVKWGNLDQTRSAFDGREIARRLLLGELQWLPYHHIFFRATRERLVNPFLPEIASDIDFVFQLLLQGQMGFVNAPLFYTRYHKSSVTAGAAADGGLFYRPLTKLQRFGEDFMSPVEVQRRQRAHLFAILRHLAWWQATGRTELVTKNEQRLAQLGLMPRPIDYLIAIATWPWHKLRKLLPQQPRATMTEADFLASAFRTERCL